ncbi:MAG: alginate export family protein [Paraburkholderia sp.]|uniref:alginate export family protein n=1 Tax=Paraburkholderia sp. TaxID=1926495 RepID=UPI001205DF14|nr:alginate export family protein [Paraburkholderia sp.]TAM08363.1 MAG: alginate export family protein [Paraburkholderia sp.]TAM29941.1 MAG: alginate export family protein [Paraburkholderia sp.]
MASITRHRRQFKKAAGATAFVGLLLTATEAAQADTDSQPAAAADHAVDAGASASAGTETSTSVCAAKRPVVLFNRWQEDWSVLANPCVAREPLDGLKYMARRGDTASWLSLGANLRERVETSNAPLFGIGTAQSDTYLIQRVEIHADARLANHWQFFVQLQDARAFGKNQVTPVDKNTLDFEQIFVTYVGALGGGTFKFRVGRQEMAFDLQRFISVRDGPNVRQAFDAVWAAYEYEKWRILAYATQPVQNRDATVFDDVSNRDLTFSGVRVERKLVGLGDVSGYWSRYNRSHAVFIDAMGAERRDVWDVRYSGTRERFDWDIEGMLQTGTISDKTIFAWAVGAIAGYKLDMPWSPRVALQIDAASGDRHRHDGRVETFNGLFSNGYYFTLAGYTGYSNLIHIKPSITLKPSANLALLGALGLQWRETTGDAVYQQANRAVPGTAGKGSRWTGMYVQLRADWTIAANLIGAIEAVHFQVGDSIRQAGGRNADYAGVELKYGW